MSGHSKWHNIQKTKGAQDAKRAAAFTKIAKELIVAVKEGGGACAGALVEAFYAGCDTFVTADVKYNQFWDAQDLGMNLIDAGHFYTENPVVAVLAQKIAAAFPEIEVIISKSHADCMKFY